MSDDSYTRAVADYLAADGWDTSATRVGDDAVVVAGKRGSDTGSERLLAMVVAGADASVTPKHLKYLIKKSRERDVDRRVLTTSGTVPERVSELAAEYDVAEIDSDSVLGSSGTDGEPDPAPESTDESESRDGGDGETVASSTQVPDGPSDAGGYGGPSDAGGYGGPPDAGAPTDLDQPQGPDPEQPQGSDPSQVSGAAENPSQDSPQHPPQDSPQHPPQDSPQRSHQDVRQPVANPPQRSSGSKQPDGRSPPPPSAGQASGSLGPGRGGGRPADSGRPDGVAGDANEGVLTTRRTVLLGGLGLAALVGWQLDVLDSDDVSATSPTTGRDGFLESKAEQSGQQSSQVVLPLEVVNATGHELGGGAVGVVRVTVKRVAGSDDVDLSQATVQWDGPSATADLVHASADGSGADGHFGTEPVSDADGSHPVLNDPDDRMALVFDLGSDRADADDAPSGATGPGETFFGEQLPAGAAATLRIATADGAEIRETMTVPDSLGDEDIVSL